jgi:hypothetical protein
MCRRAPSRRCMWFIKRTPIRDLYEHAMWERCQLRAREHGCNFRRVHGLTADSGFLQRFCCWARQAEPARGAGGVSGARCAFWYVDVGVRCATRPRPFRPALARVVLAAGAPDATVMQHAELPQTSAGSLDSSRLARVVSDHEDRASISPALCLACPRTACRAPNRVTRKGDELA